MPDPVEVARLLAVTLAAHGRYRIASNALNRLAALQAVREALAALDGALLLDPTRSLPAWQQGTPQDRIRLSGAMVAFYLRYNARKEAAGL